LAYKFIRHPLYVGWIIAFWAIPTMTAGHLTFALLSTIYMFTAIPIEERDLIGYLGDHYREYRNRVPALIPMPGKGVKNVDEINAAVQQSTKADGTTD